MTKKAFAPGATASEHVRQLTRRDALKLAGSGLFGMACARSGPTPRAVATRSAAPITPPKAPKTSGSDALTTLTFGSCNKPTLDQPLWAKVLALHPDLFIWLGDCVYADTENIELTRALYREQIHVPSYAELVRKTRVVGVWDDHDYGLNDGGNEYPMRAASQQAFLDFIGEPRLSPRRRQAGVYTSYEVEAGTHSVKVILLDCRYHREAPGPTGDVLGDEQWLWLESELRNSRARVHVLGSSTQVLPEEHHSEKWADYPAARARLFDLLRAAAVPNLVLLSGDRHFAELSRLDEGNLSLVELTSSGLTHSWTALADELNSHRIGHLYNGLNFGLVQVDWNARTLRLAAIDRDGTPRIDYTLLLRS